MRYVVFDLETQNTFEDTGKSDPASLDISVGSFYDSQTKTYTTVSVDELPSVWPLLETADALVGYNSNHFDIPLLNKYYPGSLADIKSIDLLASIRDSLGKRIRLDAVAEATLGAGKSGHGLQAIVWWKAGEIEKIKEYCQRDVEITKDIFEYAKKHKKLKYKDGMRKGVVDIDTSTWGEGGSGAMTHSLPF